MKYLNTIVVVVVVIIAIIILSKYDIIPTALPWSNFIEAVSVALALLVSYRALTYAKKEYTHHKRSEKTTLLCQNLQRYSNDPYVKKLEDYILECALLDEEGNIIGFDKTKEATNPPCLWEKEMFMHFFEELQLLIDEDMIDKNVIIDLIGYYVGIFHRIPEFHQDITDYEDERYWKYYLKFVRSIPDDFYN